MNLSIPFAKKLARVKRIIYEGRETFSKFSLTKF